MIIQEMKCMKNHPSQISFLANSGLFFILSVFAALTSLQAKEPLRYMTPDTEDFRSVEKAFGVRNLADIGVEGHLAFRWYDLTSFCHPRCLTVVFGLKEVEIHLLELSGSVGGEWGKPIFSSSCKLAQSRITESLLGRVTNPKFWVQLSTVEAAYAQTMKDGMEWWFDMAKSQNSQQLLISQPHFLSGMNGVEGIRDMTDWLEVATLCREILIDGGKKGWTNRTGSHERVRGR